MALTIGIKIALPKKKKPRKAKKPKKRKKVKGSKKPLTSEMILKELVTHGMIKKSTTATFNKFIGKVSYIANELRMHPYNYDPPYCLGDIRQVSSPKLFEYFSCTL